jgi:hypothetical protein
MKAIKFLLASSTVALCAAAISSVEGCADEGVTHIAPKPGSSSGARDAGPKRDARASTTDEDDDDTGSTTDESMAGDDDDTGSADDDATDGDDDTGAADDDATDGDDDGAPAGRDAGAVDAGKADAGKADAGKADAGGGAGALPPCPSGTMCTDPLAAIKERGISGMVTDLETGEAVTATCTAAFTGPPPKCDEANPKSTCPNFTDPYCVELNLGGLIPTQTMCAQKCKP